MKRTRTKSGVYFIKNLVNGKVYAGSAVNVTRRIRTHKRLLILNRHDNIKLQNAWNKYGTDNFQSICIERIIDLESLVPREQYWIDYMDSYRNGYNLRPKANSNLGLRASDKTKRKLSEAHKGMKHTEESKRKMSKAKKGSHHSEEAKRKMSEANRKRVCPPMKGKYHTEETKKKISITKKGFIVAEETKRKISKTLKGHIGYMRGRKHTEETKRKISQAGLGHFISENTKRKIADSLKGHLVSKESRRKMSVKNKGRKLSVETKTKMSLARRGKNNPFYGKSHTEKTKKKMSQAKRIFWKDKNNIKERSEME